MVNVTKSGRKVKHDDSSSSKRRHPGSKGSTTSGSMTTDTSGLRRSARETPSKKQMASSPSNPRKSERIENRTPPTPPSKRKSERAVKQTPSLLKRSDRVEKNHPSSSSGSKKSEKSSSVLMTKKKTEDIQKNGKQPMVNAIDQSENEEKNLKPRRVMLKKRLDARSYRELLFKRKPKKPQESGPPEKLKLHDGFSPGDTDNKEASGSKEVEDGRNCSERKGEEIKREESGEGFEGAVQGSASGSEKFTSRSPRDHEEMEICRSSQKLDSPEVANGCNGDGGSSSASKFSDNSFPGVLAKKLLSDPSRTQLDSFQNEPLRKVVELMESTSEGTSVSGNAVLGNTSTDPSKRKRKVNDLDCDASITAAHKEICISSDAISSFPLEEKKNSYLEQCVSCSKRKRTC